MASRCITWPAPAGEAPSPDYTLDVDGQPVFAYSARVRAEILQNDGLWTHTPDCMGERAAFAIFDVTGAVAVTVRPARPFTTATILPARAGVAAEVADGAVRFTIRQPDHLTLLLDDDDQSPLHLFISAPETDTPSPDDPNVIYFGPGVHEVETIQPRDGQTVYLAGGAVVKARLRLGEEGTYSEQWKVTFFSGVVLDINGVSGVRVCGRGILDGSLVPHPGRNMIRLNEAHDVHISGIMLRDAPNWNVLIGKSHDVQVDNLRIISGRLNSDGINSVNSSNVQIRNCFVRNHDDSIVAKTTAPEPSAEDIIVENCQIWNDWGYGLGATYETRAPISRVYFRGCDIISARHWCMGVRVSDSATIRDITFTDIQIADLTTATRLRGAHLGLSAEPQLLYLSIDADCWGKDPNRGHIHDITLDNITVYGPMPPSILNGYDAEHTIDNVTFRNVHRPGQSAITSTEELRLTCNAFVRRLTIEA